MALLKKDSYKNYDLSNIQYWPITIGDLLGDNTGQNSTFRSSRIGDSGKAKIVIENYDNAKHIFILAPMTLEVLKILLIC